MTITPVSPLENTKRATRRALLLNRLAYVALGFAFAQALTEKYAFHTQAGVPAGVIAFTLMYIVFRYASRRILRNEISRVQTEVRQLQR